MGKKNIQNISSLDISDNEATYGDLPPLEAISNLSNAESHEALSPNRIRFLKKNGNFSGDQTNAIRNFQHLIQHDSIVLKGDKLVLRNDLIESLSYDEDNKSE